MTFHTRETILRAIRDDQYTDGDAGPGIDVWRWSVMMTLHDAGIPAASRGGLVAALVKQGLVRASGAGEDATLALTPEGFALVAS